MILREVILLVFIIIIITTIFFLYNNENFRNYQTINYPYYRPQQYWFNSKTPWPFNNPTRVYGYNYAFPPYPYPYLYY